MKGRQMAVASLGGWRSCNFARRARPRRCETRGDHGVCEILAESEGSSVVSGIQLVVGCANARVGVG